MGNLIVHILWSLYCVTCDEIDSFYSLVIDIDRGLRCSRIRIEPVE